MSVTHGKTDTPGRGGDVPAFHVDTDALHDQIANTFGNFDFHGVEPFVGQITPEIEQGEQWLIELISAAIGYAVDDGMIRTLSGGPIRLLEVEENPDFDETPFGCYRLVIEARDQHDDTLATVTYTDADYLDHDENPRPLPARLNHDHANTTLVNRAVIDTVTALTIIISDLATVVRTNLGDTGETSLDHLNEQVIPGHPLAWSWHYDMVEHLNACAVAGGEWAYCWR